MKQKAREDPIYQLIQSLLEERPSTRGVLRQLLGAATYWSWPRLQRIAAPTQVLHGTADRICRPEGTQALASSVGTDDLTVCWYDGFWHEIYHEPATSFVAGFVGSSNVLSGHVVDGSQLLDGSQAPNERGRREEGRGR